LSHESPDRDLAVQEEVRNVAKAVMQAVSELRENRLSQPDASLQAPRQKRMLVPRKPVLSFLSLCPWWSFFLFQNAVVGATKFTEDKFSRIGNAELNPRLST
jgi:hypothetical protein